MQDGHRNYSHRSIVDKLGIEPGHAIALVPHATPLDRHLVNEIAERTGREPARPGEAVDVVLVTADSATDAVALLRHWRARIRPEGGIWVLTPKRGESGYLNATDLIPHGTEAGLVDNKTCSVSPTVSGMRFVIRKSDRPTGPPPLVRPSEPSDRAAVVRMLNALEPEGPPRSDEPQLDDIGAEWVAVGEDRLVGRGALSPAWWTGDPSAYLMELAVDAPSRGRGTGTRLYDRLDASLNEHGATRVLAWIRGDALDGRRFVQQRDFRETGQVIQDYRLHLPHATTARYAGLEDELRSSGIRIVALAELDIDDESFLRSLQYLWADSGNEPLDTGSLHASFTTWREQVIHGEGLSPEAYWVTLDGDRPVGMTFLKRVGRETAENDYTAVAPDYRGRGIAQAMKVRAISWALEQGIWWFHTSSELHNAPMIAINTNLGYLPGVQRIEVERVLTSRSSG